MQHNTMQVKHNPFPTRHNCRTTFQSGATLLHQCSSSLGTHNQARPIEYAYVMPPFGGVTPPSTRRHEEVARTTTVSLLES